MEIKHVRDLLLKLFNKPVRNSERVYLRWDDINYYVPTIGR